MKGGRDERSHEDRIYGVLRGAAKRNGLAFVSQDEAMHGTPLAALIAAETPPDVDAEMAEALADARRGAFDALLGYFFADGPHPGNVLRRVFAVTWALRRELIGEMKQTEVARMFGETKAAMSWRVLQIFTGYLQSRGFRGSFKAPGQKSEDARRHSALAAAGNTNRRGGARAKKPSRST